MRSSRWIGGMAVAALAIAALFFIQFSAPAQPAKTDAKPIADDRDELANKLMERVTLKDPIENMPLKDALKQMSEKYNITLLVDRNSFGDNGAAAVAMGADNEAVLNQPINVPAMKNVRLATVIKEVADQIRGIHLIYPDHIRIVSEGRAYTVTKPLMVDYLVERPANYASCQGAVEPDNDSSIVPQDYLVKSGMDPLATVSFNEKPLEDALKEIGIRTNRTIVVANQVAENRKTPITGRFTNVPVDRAVETIAEMAGLKMFRKGNVLLVTTAARADVLAPAPARRISNAGQIPPISGAFSFNAGQVQGIGGGGFPVNPLPATDQSSEELKMKVAELEKTISELKQKK
jgi:hypothetical protein